MSFDYIKNNTKKSSIIFIILLIIFSTGYNSFNKYYQKPKEWIDETYNECKRSNPNVSDENIKAIVEHSYSYLYEKYGDVDNFPSAKNYTREDKYNLLNFTIDYAVPDSLKDSSRKNIDVLIERLDKKIQQRDSLRRL